MNFYKMVMDGAKILIEDNKNNYQTDPAIFYCNNDKLLAYAPAMGKDLDHLFGKQARFNKHIETMINLGMDISIILTSRPVYDLIDEIHNKWLRIGQTD